MLTDEGVQCFQDSNAGFQSDFAAFALAKIDPERPEIIPVLREAMHYRKGKTSTYIRGEVTRRFGNSGSLPNRSFQECARNKIRQILLNECHQQTLAGIDPNYQITDAMLLKILGNVGK